MDSGASWNALIVGGILGLLSDNSSRIVKIWIRLLDKVNENLRKPDYEGNNSQTYRMLTEFIDIIKKEVIINKLNPDQSDKLVEMAGRLRDD